MMQVSVVLFGGAPCPRPEGREGAGPVRGVPWPAGRRSGSGKREEAQAKPSGDMTELTWTPRWEMPTGGRERTKAELKA